MAPPTSTSWYLLKAEDGAIFGPVSFDQLNAWATSAQISPLDKLSSDQLSWMKAPMLPDLQMDWLVELTSEQLYGPTTLGAIQEFLNIGEISADTVVMRGMWSGMGSSPQNAKTPPPCRARGLRS